MFAGLIATGEVVIVCDVRGCVHALAAATGELLWQHRCGQESEGIFVTPFLLREEEVVVSLRSGRLESLSVSDGALLWSVAVAAGALTAVGVDPAHRCCQAAVSASGCVAAADGSVSIFDFGTRSPPVLVGRLQLPAAVFCAPLLRGRRVLVGCRDDALHCLVIGPPQTVNEMTPSA